MSDQVLEIDCEPIDAALIALRESKWFDEVALYGSFIHAIGHNLDQKIAQASAMLASKNVAVKSAEIILPSLEDVFIARLRNVDLND
jgi:hypothetical protein